MTLTATSRSVPLPPNAALSSCSTVPRTSGFTAGYLPYITAWNSSFNSGFRFASHSAFVVTLVPSNIVSRSGIAAWAGSLSGDSAAGSMAGAGLSMASSPSSERYGRIGGTLRGHW